ncbi:unnamed protein product [Polarella glacialis]|uniref:Uncharacterized protein n=1 Tax=Polarella glacialis TaxID=89957 RepID=A0A813ISQ2_POLGL|nr:unnamed protein product [Polarella glacialis]
MFYSTRSLLFFLFFVCLVSVVGGRWCGRVVWFLFVLSFWLGWFALGGGRWFGRCGLRFGFSWLGCVWFFPLVFLLLVLFFPFSFLVFWLCFLLFLLLVLFVSVSFPWLAWFSFLLF